MFDCGYLAVCTARDLGWKRVYRIVHKCSRALEQVSHHLVRGGGGHGHLHALALVHCGDTHVVLAVMPTAQGPLPDPALAFDVQGALEHQGVSWSTLDCPAGLLVECRVWTGPSKPCTALRMSDC